MKKILMVIALMAIVLTVVPQVQAQDYSKMEQELKQVETDLNAKKITPQQAQQRIMEIQQRYMGFQDATIGGGDTRGRTGGDAASQEHNRRIGEQANQQAQQALQSQQPQQQQQSFPAGATTGWPTAAILSRHSLPALRQPAGTTVSYTVGTGNDAYKLTIYLKGGTQATIDELARQLQAGTKGGSSPYTNPGEYYQSLPNPSGLSGKEVTYNVSVLLRDDGGVILEARPMVH